MFKMFIAGRRRNGLDTDGLRHYMGEVHAPRVMRYIAEQPHIAPQRYAHNYVIDNPAPATGTAERVSWAFDFFTEVCFASAADAARSIETDYYREQLRTDEACFVDQSTVVRFPVRAEPASVQPHPPADKVFVFVGYSANASADGSQNSADKHVTSAIAAAGNGILQHVRNHIITSEPAILQAGVIEEFWLADATAALELKRRLLQCEDGAVADLLGDGFIRVFAAQERVFVAGCQAVTGTHGR